MSTRSFNKICLELRASPLLAGIFLAVHGGAAMIVFLVPLPVPVRIGLAAAVAASFYRELSRHALRRSRDAVMAFELRAEDGSCALQRRGSSDWEEARLVDQWVAPRLTLLVLRLGRRRRSVGVVIAADAVEPDGFRRLRIQLRLRNAAE